MEDITLVLGDCLDVIKTLDVGSIDAVVTDPPYGMDWDTDTTRFSGGKQVVSRGKDWGARVRGDSQPFDPTPWVRCERVVMWGYNHWAQRAPLGTLLVWVKRNDYAYGSFLSDAEVAWMKGGCGVYCFRDVPNLSDKGCHPTQKTVDLMAWCLDMAKVPIGATVLDPYMGSGTTGIACVQTGRRFLGIEIDPTYYAVAQKRIAAAQAQIRMPL